MRNQPSATDFEAAVKFEAHDRQGENELALALVEAAASLLRSSSPVVQGATGSWTVMRGRSTAAPLRRGGTKGSVK